jgi:imidazoleglycerol-phosphate dehydratase/histidinol-phosphatase
MKKYLFLDRDGTLIVEPPDRQIDSYEKFALVPGVIAALARCVDAGYELVMVTNQDGMGTTSFPRTDFDGPHKLLVDILASQGIPFHDILIDDSLPEEGKTTRKPGTGLMHDYLAADDWSRADSAVIGDRQSDLDFAAGLGVQGLRLGAGFGWSEVAHRLCDRPRRASCERQTRETHVCVDVDLDAADAPRVATGIGFFDHMLEQLGQHGGFTLQLQCSGDIEVDAHHSVEDTALALGEALRRALGDKRGLARYGFTLPMDESLARCALDLSGRACFRFDGCFPGERVGDFPVEMVPHFFHSFCDGLGATLHLRVRGDNTHHMIEACFKSVARSLRQAIRREGNELASTKGVL